MGSTNAHEAPVVGTAPAPVEAIDRSYLARFTRGNAGLEREVLELFAAQAPLDLERLRTAASEADWQAAAHTIKGSAAAVGARQLQRLAEFAERVAFGLAPALRAAERAVAVDLIAAATVAVCRQIDQMFGGRNAP